MRHPQRKAVLRQPCRLFGGLPRGRQHKIHREVGKACGLCHGHCCLALRRRMAAPQQPQHVVLAVLQPEGQPVDPCPVQSVQQRKRYGSGVRLHRDFGIRRHRPPPFQGIQHRYQPRAQQGRCPPAEIDRLYFVVLRRGCFHRLDELLQVGGAQGQPAPAVKAAVSAAAAAKRHMKIDAYRFHRFSSLARTLQGAGTGRSPNRPAGGLSGLRPLRRRGAPPGLRPGLPPAGFCLYSTTPAPKRPPRMENVPNAGKLFSMRKKYAILFPTIGSPADQEPSPLIKGDKYGRNHQRDQSPAG